MTKENIRSSLEHIINPDIDEKSVSEEFLDFLFNFFSSQQLEEFLCFIEVEYGIDVPDNEDYSELDGDYSLKDDN